jgi:hypothetical protein
MFRMMTFLRFLVLVSLGTTLGVFVTRSLYRAFRRGIVSSREATYRRSKEPFKYWLTIHTSVFSSLHRHWDVLGGVPHCDVYARVRSVRLWTCVSSAPPTTPGVREPSDPVTREELQSYSQCTDRVSVPLALVAFVTSTVVTYRRASR